MSRPAFCLGFFGFMRSGEFTTSPSHRLDECTLSVTDVCVDSRQNPQVLTVLLRRNKTDQHGNGTHLHLGRTGTSLCPVSVVLAYLAIRPSSPGPLFVFQDGTPLSRTQLDSHLKEALSCIGETTANYSGHSLVRQPQQQGLALVIPSFKHWEGGDQVPSRLTSDLLLMTKQQPQQPWQTSDTE